MKILELIKRLVQPSIFPFLGGGGGPVNYNISDNTGATFSGTNDTYLLETSPTVNFGSGTTIIVKAWTTNDRTHSVIKFTGLSSVPSGGTVTNAKIRLYCQTIANDPFEVPTVNAYALRRDFVEAQATWNVYQTSSNWGTAGALDTATDYNNSLLGSVLVDIENAYYEISGTAVNTYVQNILNGTTDYGLLLVEENYLTPLNQFKEGVFTSSEGTNGQRPELTFTRTP